MQRIVSYIKYKNEWVDECVCMFRIQSETRKVILCT